MEDVFARPLHLAGRVHRQNRRQRGPKIYLLHAPEVECIGKGKAHRPYEFGAKVSGATPINRCKGGQFVAHIAALPGSLCDGHTLGKVIPAIEAQIGGITRVVADSRLPRSQCSYRLKVYISGQRRNVTQAIKRDLRRRSVVEPVMVTSRRSIAWIATISPTGPGMPSTPSSLSHPATARPGLHPELESRMPPPFTLYQTVSKTDRPLRTIVLVEAAVDFAGET